MAVSFLAKSEGGISPSVADISGIWLSSDDSTVLPELERRVHKYFPNVTADSVVSVSDRGAYTDPASHKYDLPSTQHYMVGTKS